MGDQIHTLDALGAKPVNITLSLRWYTIYVECQFLPWPRSLYLWSVTIITIDQHHFIGTPVGDC